MDNFYDNETFCSTLFNHQMVDATGRIKPCCRFNEKDRDKKNNINTISIHDSFNGEFMSNLRHMSLNNQRISGCSRCYEEQDNNKVSLRTRINTSQTGRLTEDDILDPKITYLEFSISNDCNLMCRMCDSRFSFKLFDEELQFYGTTFSKDRKTRIDMSSIYDICKDLRDIKFTGGEPLMIKEHWELLEYCISMGYAKNIMLNYSTNCTIFPKEKIRTIWKEFKHIDIALSLDSIEKVPNEYQRHLTVQEEVLENIQMYLDYANEMKNIRIISRPTVTVFNMMYMPETIDWLFSKGILCNPTHLTYPEWLSITVFPESVKKRVSDKFLSYQYNDNESKKLCMYLLSYMNSVDNSGKLIEFRKHTDFLDSSRGQSFLELFPYLAEMYQD